jgi:hypothetical protein
MGIRALVGRMLPRFGQKPARSFRIAFGKSSQLKASQSLYHHPEAFYDIRSGSDGTCSPAIFCKAGPGYDAASGMGTPNGIAAFQ